MKKPLRSFVSCAMAAALAVSAAAGFSDLNSASGSDPVIQGGGDSKPAPGQEKPKPADASAPKTSATAPMNVPLTGATADNSSAVQTAIKSITRPVWKCPDCSAVESAKGTCAACKKELVEDKSAAVVRNVSVDATKGVMQIALAAGQTLRMSELERALGSKSVTVNTGQLTVPSFAKLYIAAPADAKDSQKTVQKALTDAKLFSNVSVRVDEAKKEIVAVVEAGATPATYGDAKSAIEKAGAGFTMNDIAWTAPCPACSKAGFAQAGCKGCWHGAN